MAEDTQKHLSDQNDQSPKHPSLPSEYVDRIAAIRRVLITNPSALKGVSSPNEEAVDDIISRHGGRMAGPGSAQ